MNTLTASNHVFDLDWSKVIPADYDFLMRFMEQAADECLDWIVVKRRSGTCGDHPSNFTHADGSFTLEVEAAVYECRFVPCTEETLGQVLWMAWNDGRRAWQRSTKHTGAQGVPFFCPVIGEGLTPADVDCISRTLATLKAAR